MDKDGNQKWAKMLEEVDNPFRVGRTGSEKIPLAYLVGSGEKHPKKKHLVNGMLVDWQINLKRKKPAKNGCPYFMPSTQNTEIRTFFAHMRKTYMWQFGETDFKGFEGSLHGVINSVYAQRLAKWVSLHEKE